MSNDTKVYTLKLEVSDLINNYRKAIDEMSKGGVQPKAIKQLTAALDKLEDKTKLIQSEGAAGFKGEGGLESYRKRVDKLLISFGQMDRELGKVNSKITTFKSQAEVAEEKVKKAFSSLGFNAEDVEKAFTKVLQSENKQATTEQIITDELKKRIQTVQELGKAYRTSLSTARNQAKIGSDGVSQALGKVFNQKGEIYNLSEPYLKPRGSEQLSLYDKFINKINQAVGTAQSFEQAMNKIRSDLSGTSIERGIKNWELLEQEIRKIFEYIESKTSQTNASWSQAIAKANQLGTVEGGRTKLTGPISTEALATAKNYEDIMRKLAGVINLDVVSFEDLDKVIASTNSAIQVGSVATEQARQHFQKLALETINTARQAKQSAESFSHLKNMVLMFLSATSMFHLARRQITKTYEEIKQLDKSFASIAMVTTSTVGDMWKTYSQYADMAAKLGQRTNSVVEASALFRQQGLDTNEALKLTTDTMKLATLAGSDYKTATQEMTTAVRGFKMEMTNGAHVTDVYSTLAAHAAATVDDIASAMARTSSIGD